MMAHRQAAYCLGQLARFEEAVAEAQKAVNLAPNVKDFQQLLSELQVTKAEAEKIHDLSEF